MMRWLLYPVILIRRFASNGHKSLQVTPAAAAGGGGGIGRGSVLRPFGAPHGKEVGPEGLPPIAGGRGRSIGHMIMEMAQSGSMTLSQTWGRIISSSGPSRS